MCYYDFQRTSRSLCHPWLATDCPRPDTTQHDTAKLPLHGTVLTQTAQKLRLMLGYGVVRWPVYMMFTFNDGAVIFMEVVRAVSSEFNPRACTAAGGGVNFPRLLVNFSLEQQQVATRISIP